MECSWLAKFSSYLFVLFEVRSSKCWAKVPWVDKERIEHSKQVWNIPHVQLPRSLLVLQSNWLLFVFRARLLTQLVHLLSSWSVFLLRNLSPIAAKVSGPSFWYSYSSRWCRPTILTEPLVYDRVTFITSIDLARANRSFSPDLVGFRIHSLVRRESTHPEILVEISSPDLSLLYGFDEASPAGTRRANYPKAIYASFLTFLEKGQQRSLGWLLLILQECFVQLFYAIPCKKNLTLWSWDWVRIIREPDYCNCARAHLASSVFVQELESKNESLSFVLDLRLCRVERDHFWARWSLTWGTDPQPPPVEPLTPLWFYRGLRAPFLLKFIPFFTLGNQTDRLSVEKRLPGHWRYTWLGLVGRIIVRRIEPYPKQSDFACTETRKNSSSGVYAYIVFNEELLASKQAHHASHERCELHNHFIAFFDWITQ